LILFFLDLDFVDDPTKRDYTDLVLKNGLNSETCQESKIKGFNFLSIS
jgi:hypothetical protein